MITVEKILFLGFNIRMTLTSRNTTLGLGLITAILLFLLLFFNLYLLLFIFRAHSLQGSGFSAFLKQEELISNIAISFFCASFSILGGFFLRVYFKKTTSVEIFFFSFFILSLSFESLRVLQIVLHYQNTSILFGILVTRLIFFGRFFGLLCLFFSGLFTTWLEFQRVGIVLSISFLIPLLLSLVIPVGTDIQPDLLYSLGNRWDLRIFEVAVEFFSVMNFFIAASIIRARDYAWMGAGILLLLIGREMTLTFMGIPALLIGTASLLSGSVLFGGKTHSLYLWR